MTVLEGSTSIEELLQRLSPEETQLLQCPGVCGRMVVGAAGELPVLSECQACPWGFRRRNQFMCERCPDPLAPYDYCFLAAYALIPFLLNAFFIRMCSTRRKPISQRMRLWTVAQVASALLEAWVSLSGGLLLSRPVGLLRVEGCVKQGGLVEWYSMLNNPIVNYTRTLHCSHELVYPLYSLPFGILALQLLLLLLLRSALYVVAMKTNPLPLPSAPYYMALWTLPLMAILHALLSGMVYYSFPYLCLVTSLALNAIQLALEGRKGVCALFHTLFSRSVESLERVAVVAMHMLLLGFSLFSLAVHPSLIRWWWWTVDGATGAAVIDWYWLTATLLVILPIPTAFYLLTVRLTAPLRAVRYRRR